MQKKTIFLVTAIFFAILNSPVFSNPQSTTTPKNIIIMISDGCGYNQIQAAAYYNFGNDKGWSYQNFPVNIAMATYPDNSEYNPKKAWKDFSYVKSGKTDSAAAATAMATGTKTYKGAIGLDPDKKPVTNILEEAEKVGKATGVITSVPWPHATPAGFVAHTEKRSNYHQISKQMLQSPLEVIMGCGHPIYDDDANKRVMPKYKFIEKELFSQLTQNKVASDADNDGVLDTWTHIESKQQFKDLITGETPKRICGTAQVAETLQQKRKGENTKTPYQQPFIQSVPTLQEMTLAAFNVLDNDPDGFVIMIEGGAIDWACHDNQTARLIEEEIEFSNTVDTVVKWIEQNSSWDDTLLIVTADHETGYITGPGSGKKLTQSMWYPLVNNGKNNVPSLEWHEGGHTNSLVPFFAKGKNAKIFKAIAINSDTVRGPYIDNTDIANTIFKMLE